MSYVLHAEECPGDIHEGASNICSRCRLLICMKCRLAKSHLFTGVCDECCDPEVIRNDRLRVAKLFRDLLRDSIRGQE